MGNLASFLSLNKPEPVKLLLLGLDAAGKTSILYRWACGEEIQSVIVTFGFNVETAAFRGNFVTAWDVGGGQKLRPLWRFYAKDVDGLVFVIDSSDRDHLDYAKDVLYRDILTMEELRKVPLLIFGNKQDLPNALSAKNLAERLNTNDLKAERPCRVVPSVATYPGNGLEEGLQWLRETVLRKKNGESAEG